MSKCLKADLDDPQHADAIVMLLDAYARDPMGGGQPLSQYARDNLVAGLRARPGVLVILGYLDGAPAGLAICFEGFSTFACKPLLNIHDLVVLPEARRRGVASALLAKVEAAARASGCCKLTLEVLEGNLPAQRTYATQGFEGYALKPEMGKAMMWQKQVGAI